MLVSWHWGQGQGRQGELGGNEGEGRVVHSRVLVHQDPIPSFPNHLAPFLSLDLCHPLSWPRSKESYRYIKSYTEVSRKYLAYLWHAFECSSTMRSLSGWLHHQ